MTAPAAPAPEKSSLMEDLIDILFSPSKVFARRAKSGAAGIFFVVVILGAVLSYVNAGAMSAMMDAEATRAIATAMEQNPGMTEDQANGIRGFVEVMGKWGAIIIYPIALLVLGLFTMIVGKVMKGTIGYGTALMIASFAYVPRVIESMGVAIQALLLDVSTFTGRYSYSLGVGRFMDSSGKQGLYNLLGRIDLFTIWVTILLVLGLVHAAKMPKEKAAVAGVVLWVIGAIPALYALATGA